MIYALDTNTISYWLQNNRKIVEQLTSIIETGDTVVIPPTAYYEIRRGFKHKSAPGKEFAFSLMCESYGVGEMNLAAWEQAAEIYGKTRKSGQPIEDTDILIAAFCIVNDYTLITNNIKHFIDMDGLALENWMAE